MLSEELGKTKTLFRIPVLVAVDGAQALFSPSGYTDINGQRIDAFQLSVPKLLLDLISERGKSFKGGVLFATSAGSAVHQSRPLKLALAQIKASHAYDRDLSSPYLKYAQGIDTIEMDDRIARLEAKGLAELLHESRLMRNSKLTLLLTILQESDNKNRT